MWHLFLFYIIRNRISYNIIKKRNQTWSLSLIIYLYIFLIYYFLFTKSFNALPALKTGAFDAGILISSLVCGFLPFLAALFLTSKDPNPTN